MLLENTVGLLFPYLKEVNACRPVHKESQFFSVQRLDGSENGLTNEF
jgi:hypothetical protein